MEEKKLDRNSIIGFLIIAGLLIWMMLNNINKEQESIVKDNQKAEKEQIDAVKADTIEKAIVEHQEENDSLGTIKASKLKESLGSFAYSGSLASAQGGSTVVKNEVISLTVANKGGAIENLQVNDFKRFSKNSGEIVELIKDNNAKFNL